MQRHEPGPPCRRLQGAYLTNQVFEGVWLSERYQWAVGRALLHVVKSLSPNRVCRCVRFAPGFARALAFADRWVFAMRVLAAHAHLVISVNRRREPSDNETAFVTSDRNFLSHRRLPPLCPANAKASL